MSAYKDNHTSDSGGRTVALDVITDRLQILMNIDKLKISLFFINLDLFMFVIFTMCFYT